MFDRIEYHSHNVDIDFPDVITIRQEELRRAHRCAYMGIQMEYHVTHRRDGTFFVEGPNGIRFKEYTEDDAHARMLRACDGRTDV